MTPEAQAFADALLGVCQRCQSQPGRDEHTCPFQVDINDNHRLCNCCQTCTGDCADEV